MTNNIDEARDMNIDTLTKIKEKYKVASKKINNGDYKGALESAYEIKDSFEPNCYVSDVLGCLLIDIGDASGNEIIVKEGIELIEDDFEAIVNNEENPSNAYYNLANGYHTLFSLNWDEKAQFNNIGLNKAKENYRKALEYNSKNPEVFVNLGNCYDHLGRRFDSLECYERALELKPNHAMALANKGITLCKYAFLLGRRWRTILIEAHYFISKGLEIGVSHKSKKSFIIWLNWIENKFEDKNVFKNPPEFPGYKITAESEDNQILKEQSMENKLYLNACTFCQKCDAAIGDTINIEKMNIKIDDNYSFENNPYIRLSSYLNQIKEEYIAARLLLTLSKYKKLNLDFAYEDAIFIDTLDYTIHNVNLQMIRLSFKNFYDILDKIAYYINEVLILKIPEFWIDFRKIWYSHWDGKPEKSKIHTKIINAQSDGLNALFDIHWDFEENGPYNNLRITRNALTHRFVVVKTFCRNETNEEMTEDTLVKETLKLAKIVRNAIFYLMYFVNEMETKKLKNTSNIS